MSWRKVKLGDFLINRESRYKPKDVAISGLKRIDKIDFSGQICLSDKPSNTDMIIVKNGDLVISGINVEKGAMSVYEGNEDVTATIHYSSYSYNDKKIDIEFLKYFLKSSEFKEAIKEQVPGGIKTEIKPKHLLTLEIIIPTDIEEQKRVILEFQKEESKNSNITTELTHQLTLVSQLRQSFLREAMQGRLLPQNPSDEPASELLKKIKTQKEQLVKEGKAKKEKLLPPIKLEDIPFEIPENWVWCRLGELLNEIKYGTSVNCDYDFTKNSPVLRIPNVSSGILNADDLKFANLSVKEKSELALETNDILIIRSNGSRELVGRTVLVLSEFTGFAYAGYLIRLRFDNGLINSKYVWFVSTSPFFRTLIENPLRTTVGINNINTQEISNLLIPFPPLPEQHRIVAKLAELMQNCDALEASIKQSKEQNEKLLQQVLREALQNN